MSSFTKLIIEDMDGRNFRIVQPFEYHIGSESSSEVIRVPAGFITDFASTPQFLWDIFPKEGLYDKAAALHDFLYRIGAPSPTGSRYTRKESDMIFRQAMQSLGVSWAQRWAMWAGVRIGGASSYRIHPSSNVNH